jgi:hypothetical protein
MPTRVRLDQRDGGAVQGEPELRVTALEDAEVVSSTCGEAGCRLTLLLA